MRSFLLFFMLPMAFYWSWYLLSLNDISFGFFMYSREMNDLVFETYGAMVGVPPETLPPLVLKACIVDTAIVLGIWALRRRKEIAAWVRGPQEGRTPDQIVSRYVDASPNNG